MEFCYKNTSKIRKDSGIFQIFEKNFQTSKRIDIIHMDLETSINSFEISQDMLPYYLLDFFY